VINKVIGPFTDGSKCIQCHKETIMYSFIVHLDLCMVRKALVCETLVRLLECFGKIVFWESAWWWRHWSHVAQVLKKIKYCV